MLKQLTAILLIVAFATQTFYNGFIMLDYFSNKVAYAKNCENKARPKMHCNGKCQMMKKLKEQQKKDAQVPERKFENKIEVLSSKSFFCSLQNNVILIVSKAISYHKQYPIKDISYAFFHPPRV